MDAIHGESSSLYDLTIVNKLSSYIQLLKENVKVTVLLERLTALLKYLDLVLQTLNKLLGSLNLA